MRFSVHIQHVQHVVDLHLELDLSQPRLICLVGRNGVGKTTLARAVRTLAHADTFVRTAPGGIFGAQSLIRYALDGKVIEFAYQADLGLLNCKQRIPPAMRRLCAVELAMPHGERFTYFRTMSDIDRDYRHHIALEQYAVPKDLIAFLQDIYGGTRYGDLFEIRVKGKSYYGRLLKGGRYVREDYLSSAEYFLINLYRTMRSGASLIVVDEIDISLDAVAQVNLVRKLRELSRRHECSVLFTTNSLAMIRMLDADELRLIDDDQGRITLVPATYAFINSVLFGFTGWDRYLLVEDDMAMEFVQYFIQRRGILPRQKYKILPVGTATAVCDLLRRNRAAHFLAADDAVAAVIDGDQRGLPHAREPRVHLLPFDNVEKVLLDDYNSGAFPVRLSQSRFNNGKMLWNQLVKQGRVPAGQIYELVIARHERDLLPLEQLLKEFLGH